MLGRPALDVWVFGHHLNVRVQGDGDAGAGNATPVESFLAQRYIGCAEHVQPHLQWGAEREQNNRESKARTWVQYQ